MGKVKQLWMDEIEKVQEDYRVGWLSRAEAMDELRALHLDPHDAANALDSVVGAP